MKDLTFDLIAFNINTDTVTYYKIIWLRNCIEQQAVKGGRGAC